MPDHPMRRDADRGTIGKTKSFMQDWGWAVYIVVSILIALGFEYKTPREEIQDLRANQVTLTTAITKLETVTKEQAADISTIVRLQCFNDAYTTKQLNLVGIHCDGIR